MRRQAPVDRSGLHDGPEMYSGGELRTPADFGRATVEEFERLHYGADFDPEVDVYRRNPIR